MSYQKFVTLFCDECGDGRMTSSRYVSDARDELADWDTSPEKDVCPSCVARSNQ